MDVYMDVNVVQTNWIYLCVGVLVKKSLTDMEPLEGQLHNRLR